MQPDSISHGAVKAETEHRRDICSVGRWIHDRGYVASTDGNLSLRLGPDRILITPTLSSVRQLARGRRRNTSVVIVL